MRGTEVQIKSAGNGTEGLADLTARAGHLQLGITDTESHPMRAKPYGDPGRTEHPTPAVTKM